jgi:hypothetical protein
VVKKLLGKYLLKEALGELLIARRAGTENIVSFDRQRIEALETRGYLYYKDRNVKSEADDRTIKIAQVGQNINNKLAEVLLGLQPQLECYLYDETT